MKRYEKMSDKEFREYMIKNMIRVVEDVNHIIQGGKTLNSSFVQSADYGNLAEDLKDLLYELPPIYANEWN